MDEKKKSPVARVEDSVPPRPAGNVSERKGLWGPWGAAMPQTEVSAASEPSGSNHGNGVQNCQIFLVFKKSWKFRVLCNLLTFVKLLDKSAAAH